MEKHFRVLLLAVAIGLPASAMAQSSTENVALQVKALNASVRSFSSHMRSRMDALKQDIDGLKAQMAAMTSCMAQSMDYMPNRGCTKRTVGFTKTKVYKSGSPGRHPGAYGDITSGWHTICVMGVSHDQSNHWMGVAYGPNAAGKSRFRLVKGVGPTVAEMICFD